MTDSGSLLREETDIETMSNCLRNQFRFPSRLLEASTTVCISDISVSIIVVSKIVVDRVVDA